MGNVSNNKRVTQNTLYLYIRMFVTMFVTFYTSRIVLEYLGVIDFGIYNIVGGVVVLFSFLNTAMTTSTQRFLNIELGKANNAGAIKIFSMSITIHFFLAIIILILAESIGLWFLNSQINIPEDRIEAANWVYQFSLFTFLVQILRVPYNASIIANERMSFYAYVTIAETIFKLLIVFLLIAFGGDRLIMYAFLVLFVAILIYIIYYIYCKRYICFCRYCFFYDYTSYKELLTFSGWSIFGNISNVSVQQGSNILLNIFFGVSINAATGIANQITHAVYNFVSNFQIAFNPFLTKIYAENKIDELKNKIIQLSRFSFFLYFIIAFPLFLTIDFVLEKWLIDVPEYTDIFARFIIVYLIFDVVSSPLWITAQAIGNIQKYQIIIGIVTLVNLPLSYILLQYYDYPPLVWIIRIFIAFFLFGYRIRYVNEKIGLPIILFFKEVIFKNILLLILGTVFPIIMFCWIGNNSWMSFIITFFIAFISSCLSVYLLGLKKQERNHIASFICNKIIKK
ncbi:lipopolysaccharide biosynthesis protein [Bacteroides sp. 519]|uniref:lipopolysaccharide biosynthesis protein n=1 Tax=Bacteroides sp. 519 TaxID=2302937 RepID=UPI0013D533ED|nr:MATE family efflux transporter [Bacteroides sp. 519]NDV60289.1 lipopolysaccharide biosynthesis protein [Bacteroides sp. 519]